ncbi:MAG: phosphatidylglycerophosphatase A [Alphaproteobacteria bacterium]|nr:phosphatidylglycerophosphatase A [Alphaproteobacteria bacterium]
MTKLHELLLTFFYCGKSPVAPGTVGSFAAVFFWMLMTGLMDLQDVFLLSQNIFWGFFVVSLFAYGCEASEIYSKKLKQIDHPTIVLDEVVGQVLALQMSYSFVQAQYFTSYMLLVFHPLLCFLLFRFFDIKKPWLIGRADKKFKNGFGVMFDDILAGLAAGVVVALLTVVIL